MTRLHDTVVAPNQSAASYRDGSNAETFVIRSDAHNAFEIETAESQQGGDGIDLRAYRPDRATLLVVLAARQDGDDTLSSLPDEDRDIRLIDLIFSEFDVDDFRM